MRAGARKTRTMFVIVPNHVSDAINEEIDRYLKINPSAEKDRQEMYNALLDAYNEHGVIAKLQRPSLDDGLDDSVIGSSNES